MAVLFVCKYGGMLACQSVARGYNEPKDMSILPFANQNVYDLVAYQPGKPIEETAR